MPSLTELIQLYPRESVVLISLAITFAISLINYFFLDKERMHEIKSKQKALQEQAKQHQKAGNHEKAMELQKEMLTYTLELMRHSFKPMIITLIPILIIFAFIRGVYSQTEIASSWFWWYFISAIIGSLIFRKILKLP